MTVATRPTEETAARHKPHEQLPAIAPPRLPYHPAIQERFGIDKASWKALVEAIFPNATSTESVILALSYCRARKLDPFKRNVHIVPIWNKEMRRYTDTIWPGIGELRTTAFRTGEYAGRGATTFGEDVTRKVGSVELTFPEWAQVTVYRMVKGLRVEFAGPRVYWLETYASIKRDDNTPNDMWANRPRGQVDKCAEAAALRAAFPEEIGTDYIPEEVQHGKPGQVVEGTAVQTINTLDSLADRLLGDAAAPEHPGLAPGEIPNDDPPIEVPPATDPLLLDDAAAGFAACIELSEVGKFESECAAKAATEADQAAIAGMANEARERIRSTRGSRSNATRQRDLAS